MPLAVHFRKGSSLNNWHLKYGKLFATHWLGLFPVGRGSHSVEVLWQEAYSYNWMAGHIEYIATSVKIIDVYHDERNFNGFDFSWNR